MVTKEKHWKNVAHPVADIDVIYSNNLFPSREPILSLENYNRLVDDGGILRKKCYKENDENKENRHNFKHQSSISPHAC